MAQNHSAGVRLHAVRHRLKDALLRGGRNSTGAPEGTKPSPGRGSLHCTEKRPEFYPFLLVFAKDTKRRRETRGYFISSSSFFVFFFLLSSLHSSPGQDTQLRSILDERELGISLGVSLQCSWPLRPEEK